MQGGWEEIGAAVQGGTISILEYTRLMEELGSEEPKTSDATPQPAKPTRGFRTWGTIGATGGLLTATILYYATPSDPSASAPPAIQQSLPILESPPIQSSTTVPVEPLPTGEADSN
jgi:hypothetical protein